MSITLATVADALIEFILSLLRDPEVASEFDADPQAALGSRGLSQVRAEDVCAVAPIIAERPAVMPASSPSVAPSGGSSNPVVREIQNIVNNFTIDNNTTIVDQSVNQNIWAGGDVTQVFDNEAIVASGDDSIAAGENVDIDQTQDNSTTITAGDDANVGNDTETTVIDDSFNEDTDASTTTDASTDTTTTDSNNDSSTNTTADDSYNDSASTYTESTVDSDSTTVYDSSDVVIDGGSADGDL